MMNHIIPATHDNSTTPHPTPIPAAAPVLRPLCSEGELGEGIEEVAITPGVTVDEAGEELCDDEAVEVAADGLVVLVLNIARLMLTVSPNVALGFVSQAESIA